MMFASNAEDPYMTAPEEADRGEDGEEDDDMLLSDADAMLLACAVDEGESNLEGAHLQRGKRVPSTCTTTCRSARSHYVSRRSTSQPGSLGAPDGSGDYVGNFAAIGTFEPEIEIINLDVSDAIEPRRGARHGGARAHRCGDGPRVEPRASQPPRLRLRGLHGAAVGPLHGAVPADDAPPQ